MKFHDKCSACTTPQLNGPIRKTHFELRENSYRKPFIQLLIENGPSREISIKYANDVTQLHIIQIWIKVGHNGQTIELLRKNVQAKTLLNGNTASFKDSPKDAILQAYFNKHLTSYEDQRQ